MDMIMFSPNVTHNNYYSDYTYINGIRELRFAQEQTILLIQRLKILAVKVGHVLNKTTLIGYPVAARVIMVY